MDECDAVRPFVGSPGLLQVPLWVVLGCSRGLCGWSWATLGVSEAEAGSDSATASAAATARRNDDASSFENESSFEARSSARFEATLEALRRETGPISVPAWFAADAEAELFHDTAESSPRIAVAKLVPAVSNLAGRTLADPRGAFGAAASCPKVRELTREMW